MFCSLRREFRSLDLFFGSCSSGCLVLAKNGNLSEFCFFFDGFSLVRLISVRIPNNWVFGICLKFERFLGFKIGSCGFDFRLEVEFSEIGLMSVDPMLCLVVCSSSEMFFILNSEFSISSISLLLS